MNIEDMGEVPLGELTPIQRLEYAGCWARWVPMKTTVLIVGDTGTLTAIVNPAEPQPQYVQPSDLTVRLGLPRLWSIKAYQPEVKYHMDAQGRMQILVPKSAPPTEQEEMSSAIALRGSLTNWMRLRGEKSPLAVTDKVSELLDLLDTTIEENTITKEGKNK